MKLKTLLGPLSSLIALKPNAQATATRNSEQAIAEQRTHMSSSFKDQRPHTLLSLIYLNVHQIGKPIRNCNRLVIRYYNVDCNVDFVCRARREHRVLYSYSVL